MPSDALVASWGLAGTSEVVVNLSPEAADDRALWATTGSVVSTKGTA